MFILYIYYKCSLFYSWQLQQMPFISTTNLYPFILSQLFALYIYHNCSPFTSTTNVHFLPLTQMFTPFTFTINVHPLYLPQMFTLYLCQKCSIFFLSCLYKICLTSYKNFNFSNYCKPHQYIWDFKVLGHFVIQRRHNRGAKSGYKNRFTGRASSKHWRFQTIVGKYRSTFYPLR